jgi:hypothetical protein
MHGTMNLKFISAKQAKEVYEYKNIKQKLHKTTAAIWFKLFIVVIADARNHEAETYNLQFQICSLQL